MSCLSLLQYPDTDEDDAQSTPTTRPNLTLVTASTEFRCSYSDPTDSRPNSAVAPSPYSAASTVSPSSPLLSDVDATLVAQPIRAQSLQPTRQGIYPPPSLPQLLSGTALRGSDASQDSAGEATPNVSSACREGKDFRQPVRLSKSASLPTCSAPLSETCTTSPTRLAHPYARIDAKKAAAPSGKRRKMWNHALEKNLFTPEEISSLRAPNRRAVYTASLEYHIDQLHEQLHKAGLYPVPLETLDQYRGLNSKTAKVGRHKFMAVQFFFPDSPHCRAWSLDCTKMPTI